MKKWRIDANVQEFHAKLVHLSKKDAKLQDFLRKKRKNRKIIKMPALSQELAKKQLNQVKMPAHLQALY